MKHRTYNIKRSTLNVQEETQRIVDFMHQTLQKQGFKYVVLGLSGGIDSVTSLYLLAKALPPQHIFVSHTYYFQKPSLLLYRMLDELEIPEENRYIKSIKSIVDNFERSLNERLSQIRLGNIMARVRMIVLFDLAKKHKALVCGTENKTEHLLGYFTRFGDSASDFEPIQHLYKTQVKQLAQHLGVPKEVIDQAPTAGLWTGQTDENEFGFTYQEADKVLSLHFDKKLNAREIEKKGFKHAETILDRVKNNDFKHKTPYFILS